MDNNNYLVSPFRLVERAKSVKGFDFVSVIREVDLLMIAEDVVADWSCDWNEDEGFGSSDFSAMIKDFLYHLVLFRKLQNYLEVGFFPYLEVREKVAVARDYEEKHWDDLASYNERFN